MKVLHQRFSILGLILVSSLTLWGCATRGYVRKQVATVDPKIAQVNTSITETNDRVDAIDRRAQGASATADAADRKATAALQAASVADSKADAAALKADGANKNVQLANNRMKSGDARATSLDGYTPGALVMIMFKVNSDALGGGAKQKLDAVANSVAGQQSGYLIEIHGFTDSTGSEIHNTSLSQRRAESTLRYLVGKGVPLHLTSIVGLGEEKPIADNNAAGGREQNRRAEIRVLQSTAPRSN